MEKVYTEDQVLDAIVKAFWDGLREGQSGHDYAGDNFSAKDYLPND